MDAVARNADGGVQEMVFETQSSLTNSHYADVFSCLWLLQVIQPRNQQEFFCCSQRRKIQEANQKMLAKKNALQASVRRCRAG